MNQNIERDSTHGPQLFGQPRGLATLFLTEMWERFTYYGMRAILILFMAGAVADGGLGLDDKTASAIYGLYIPATYLLSLLGGWIADRLIGQQRAVFWGGVLIMLGNGSLAAGDTQLFFIGLHRDRARRRPAQAEHQRHRRAAVSRKAARAAMPASRSSTWASTSARSSARSSCRSPRRRSAGARASRCRRIGMLLGLVQFQVDEALPRRRPASCRSASRRRGGRSIGFMVVVVVVAALALTGALALNPVAHLRVVANWTMIALAAGYFAYLLFFAGLDLSERKRVVAMIALFVGVRHVLGGLRADRRVAQPVRRPPHRSR